MSQPDWPSPAVDVCCGRATQEWAGKPFVLGCQVCPNSPTWWQRGRAKPYGARPGGGDLDQAAIDARLAEIVADETWPEDLRAEAELAAEDGLDVYELTDDAIVTALNRRIVARDEGGPVRRSA